MNEPEPTPIRPLDALAELTDYDHGLTLTMLVVQYHDVMRLNGCSSDDAVAHMQAQYRLDRQPGDQVHIEPPHYDRKMKQGKEDMD